MRSFDRLIVVTCLLLCAVRAAADGDFGGIEEDLLAQKGRMAKTWIELSEDLAKKDLRAEALDAVARAEALAPEAPGIAEAKARAEGLAGKGVLDDPAKKAIAKTRREVAKGYEALAAVLEDEQQDSRYTEFLVAALGTEPTKDRQRVLAEMAKKEPLLLTAPGHPFSALVSLPKTWRTGKEYPVLVCVEGEAIAFPLALDRYRDVRGSREWILVCPHTLTSAVEVLFDRYPAYPEAVVREWNFKRLEFDSAGLLPLLDFLHAHLGAAERVTFSAFSSGATIALHTVLTHPERVAHAVFSCPKADPAASADAPSAKDGGPPVLVLAGERDPSRAADVDATMAALKDRGFTHAERRTVAGAARSDFPKEAWDFADPAPTKR